MGQGQAMSLLMRAFYRSGNMMLKNQIRKIIAMNTISLDDNT